MTPRPPAAALAALTLALALVAGGCKSPPTMEAKLSGRWRAKLEYGARTSKDPLVAGVARVWGGGELEIWLRVDRAAIEVERYSQRAGAVVLQRVTMTALDGDRVALSGEHGRVVARAALGCTDGDTACLSAQFLPEPGASAAALESMAYLFGCDDAEGNIDCSAIARPRTFYRVPAGASGK